MNGYRGIPVIIDRDRRPYCRVEESDTRPLVIYGDCNLRKEVFIGKEGLETRLTLYLIDKPDLSQGTLAIRLYAGGYQAEITIRKDGNDYFLERIYRVYKNMGRETLLQINRSYIPLEKLYNDTRKFALENDERKAYDIVNSILPLIPDVRVRKLVAEAYR